KDHQCVDCRGPARDWSLIHGRDGNDPADFEPRCRKCHIAYDQPNHAYPSPGERNGSAKLTWVQVREIRALRGIVTALTLAERYGVARGCINMIMQGRTWKEPPPTPG